MKFVPMVAVLAVAGVLAGCRHAEPRARTTAATGGGTAAATATGDVGGPAAAVETKPAPARPNVAPAGAKTEIVVLCDRGATADLAPRQQQWRNEVGAWMEPDLVRELNRAGYQASLIASRDKFEVRAGRYLLAVKITSYNPGSTAARIMVGYGAGSAALNTHYELFGADAKAVLTWDDGVGTSQNWQRLPRKLNENTVKRLNDHLRAK